MMPRCYICITVLLITFLSADCQKISKTDKVSLANLQTHVRSLSGDTAGGCRMGSPAEKATGDYIISALSQTGARPKGDNGGWLQTVTIDEGRRLGADAGFEIDDQSLALGRDWFPLALCPAGQVSGSPAIALQERGVPWFQDLKEMLDAASGAHGLMTAIRAKAAAFAKKGATALILYNSSTHHADKLAFDPGDRAEPAAIPVIYMTKEARKKFIPDESASVDIRIRISYTEQEETGHNVIALMDKGAAATAVIATRYDNSTGAAAMLELARLLAASKLRNNNFLFIVFSGNGPVRSGSAWYGGHPAIDGKKINYMLDLGEIGDFNDTTRLLTVGGYNSSAAWPPLWNSIRDRRYFSFRYDSSAAGPGDHAIFYRQHIPVLVFSTGTMAPAGATGVGSRGAGGCGGSAGDPVNYPGELQVLKFVYALIAGADTRGRITPAPAL
jgi:hypothetical protein